MWPAYLRSAPDGVQLSLKVQPRASRNEVAESAGEALRIRVTAPPVDSAANEAVVELLAEVLDCPKGAVRLVRGKSSRRKVVMVVGMTPESVMKRLAAIE